jgi:erythromycin esterase-like protein
MPGPDDEDLESLDGLLAGREVVALGETVHGINTFAELRSRAIRFLVEKRGYRAISFEGPWLAAERTRAYIEHGQGTLDDAMRGLTFLAWGNRPTVELVVWLRAFNQAHPGDPVRFFGADPQQPADDAVLLRRFLGAERTEGLEACVCGAFDSTAACSRDPVESAIIAGQQPLGEVRLERCLATTSQLLAFLHENEAQLTASLGAQDFLFATMAAEGIGTFSQVVVSVAALSHEGVARSHELRDSLWARNFLRLKALRAPTAKTVIWGHNFHIMRRSTQAKTLQAVDQARFPMRSMGTWLGESLGDRYGAIGLFAYRQAFNFSGTAVQTYPDRSGATDGERRLFELSKPTLFVHLTRAPLFDDRTPLSWSVPTDEYVVGRHFDGLLYVQDTEPSVFE